MSAPQDPRHRNATFPAGNLPEFFGAYVSALQGSLAQVSTDAVAKAGAALQDAAQRDAQILAIGNGGSASIADHLSCDWTKGTCSPGRNAIRAHSLAANAPLLTALANDFGYDQTFSRQLEMFARSGDVLVAISSSGRSANILAALRTARVRGLSSIAFTGFDGGEAAKLADISIHVPFHNYGIVEDCHQTIMHCLAQYLAATRDRG